MQGKGWLNSRFFDLNRMKISEVSEEGVSSNELGKSVFYFGRAFMCGFSAPVSGRVVLSSYLNKFPQAGMSFGTIIIETKLVLCLL